MNEVSNEMVREDVALDIPATLVRKADEAKEAKVQGEVPADAVKQ